MKTSEEIKKALRMHLMPSHPRGCIGCAYRNKAEHAGECVGRLYRDTVEYIKQLEAQVPEWIPVTERLPENGQTVIVFAPNCEPQMHVWHYGGDELWFDERDRYVARGCVITHWMPLPSAPEEVVG